MKIVISWTGVVYFKKNQKIKIPYQRKENLVFKVQYTKMHRIISLMRSTYSISKKYKNFI